MKHLMFAITLLSGTLLAQTDVAPAIPTGSSPGNGPSYSQMYCSGFVTREAIPRTNFIVGSKETPHEVLFPGRSVLFLGGPSLVEGQRYSVLRQVSDPNHEDSSPEQRKKLARLGQLYQEIGWVTVHSVDKGASVASFDFSCDPAIPGDIIVPFREKPTVAFRSTDAAVSSFAEDAKAPAGQILGSKDFVGLLGTGQVVYTDFGGAKGARPGDYLVILRGYSPGDLNRIDRASERLPKGSDATTVDQAQIPPGAEGRAPHRVLGEILVLSVTPESSTSVITRSFAEMELGDVVVNEDGHAASSYAPKDDDPTPCRQVSRVRRMLFLGHG
jgi:hypothetical protein